MTYLIVLEECIAVVFPEDEPGDCESYIPVAMDCPSIVESIFSLIMTMERSF